MTLAFYVIDEGEATEAAYWIKRPPRPADDFAKAIAYMESLDGVVRYSAEAERAEQGFAIMRVWQRNLTGGVDEKRLLLYYDDAGNATHKTIAG